MSVIFPLGGTAPSNFGKFRGADHQSAAEGIMTEDEEDEEENGHSLYGSEYGETTPQYCVQPVGPSLVTDWLPGHNDGQRMDTSRMCICLFVLSMLSGS